MSTKTISPYSAQDEKKLMSAIWAPEIADDPEAFVMFIFPWGKKGTPLENVLGPRKWQRKILRQIKEHIQANKHRMTNKQDPLVFRAAVVSGRGIGKSALVAWLNLFMMSTALGSTCVNTANTEDQLKNKTWAELGKWHTLALNSHWFEKTAMSLRPTDWFQDALKKQLKVDTGYYYSQATLWSEEKPDSFAGVHNFNGVLLVFDEASGIPAPIWKVSEGFFTEPVLHRYWFVFSNGRRNTGPFFECFHKLRDFWNRISIDSRTVEGTDKAVFDEIIAKYGEDSDEARTEVKGEFPRQGDKQFISRSTVEDAAQRDLVQDDHAALMMGVDPARFGDDCTVIRFRQGRNGRVIPAIKMKGADNMEVANRCAELITQYNPDAVCIDVGNGSGIIDRLREMGYKIYEVGFGNASPEPEWANMRTYLWAKMRDWLGGSCIDSDTDLVTDLTAPEYKFQGNSDRIMLQTKESMKSIGFSSPDNADALACTFFVKVARRDLMTSRAFRNAKARVAKGMDYDIFG